MIKFLSTLVFLLLLTSVNAQDSTLLHKAERLLEVTGAKNQFLGAADQIIAMQRQNAAFDNEMGKAFWDDFSAEIHQEAYESIRPLIVDIYLKNYTEAELDYQIEFYSSEIGKRIVDKQGGVMQQSMAVGQQWGMELGQKVATKLQEAIDGN